MISIIQNSKKINKELKEYKDIIGVDTCIDNVVNALYLYILGTLVFMSILLGSFSIYLDKKYNSFNLLEFVIFCTIALIMFTMHIISILYIDKIQLDMYKKVYTTNLIR